MNPAGIAFLDRLDRPALVAMIHVGALPGTPGSKKTVVELAEDAAAEARLLTDGGVDAVLLENMHDAPYLNRAVGPEIVAAMTAISSAVRGATPLPLGIQILAGANREALAVAHAADLQFIRAEGFVFAHVADEGLMPQADAGPLLRYRRMIGAEPVAIIADVKKKHAAHAVTTDLDLAETARAAAFFGADGVVVTGAATGQPTAADDVAAVARALATEACGAQADSAPPVFVGSGVRPENLAALATAGASAFIVGSYLKRDGRWFNEPDPARVAAMVAAIEACTCNRT